MTRFYGSVGYAEQVEDSPGVFIEVIREEHYYGDVLNPSRDFDPGASVNGSIRTGNQISVLADQKLNEHFFDIRWVLWNGVKWSVTNVDVVPPRLVLRLGEKYNVS